MSAYFYGIFVGAIFYKSLEEYSPKIIWILSLFIMIVVNYLFLQENMMLMATCRFIHGIAAVINNNVSEAWITQTALPQDKDTYLILGFHFYYLANIIIHIISLQDNGSSSFWKGLVALASYLGIVILILSLIIVRKIISIPSTIRLKGYEETLKSAEKIYDPKSAKIFVKKFQKEHEDIKEAKRDKTKGYGFYYDLIKYKRDVVHIIILNLTCAVSFYAIL